MNEEKTLAVGLDVGTMHLVASRNDSEEVKITRNVFLTVDKDDVLNLIKQRRVITG